MSPSPVPNLELLAEDAAAARRAGNYEQVEWIAKTMLRVETLPPALRVRLHLTNVLIRRAGGELRSRQAVAEVVVGWLSSSEAPIFAWKPADRELQEGLYAEAMAQEDEGL